MEYFSSFLFGHGPSAVDLVEELSILAVLHEDVDLAVLADHFVDLGDILVKQILLQFDLPLDGFELLGVVVVDRGDLNRHHLSSEPVDGLLDLPEAALANRLL